MLTRQFSDGLLTRTEKNPTVFRKLADINFSFSYTWPHASLSLLIFQPCVVWQCVGYEQVITVDVLRLLPAGGMT
jgi:hypothetical protein